MKIKRRNKIKRTTTTTTIKKQKTQNTKKYNVSFWVDKIVSSPVTRPAPVY